MLSLNFKRPKAYDVVYDPNQSTGNNGMGMSRSQSQT